MTIEKLKNAFVECKKNNIPICVAIKIHGQLDEELIINGINSFDNKLNYYLKNYDEDCNHKNGSGVKIIDAFPIEFRYEK